MSRFVRWGNFFIDKIVKDESTNKVKSMEVSARVTTTRAVYLCTALAQEILLCKALSVTLDATSVANTKQGRFNPEAKNFSKTKKATWLTVVVRKDLST